MRYCTLQTVVTVLRWHCLKTEGGHEATLLEAGQQHLHVTTGSSSFSGCASYLAFRTVTSARKNYQNSFSSSKFTLRHNCASATEDTHQKSPFVFLYLAHLPLQNVKTKQNMVPEVAPYDLGQNQQAMHSSLWHRSFTWHWHIGPAPNHPGGIWWLEERS